MNSPSTDYKAMKNINGISDTAYFTIFEKYLKYNLKAEEKLIEIDSTDQESIIWGKNGGYPIPGFIYTFLYKGPDVEVKLPPDTIKQYTDKIPLVFCMGTDKNMMGGINLNVLPPKVRLQFLDSFYDVYKAFLEREVDVLAQNNKLALNKKFIATIRSGNGQKLIQAFSKRNGANYKFGYRKYYFNKIVNLRMVEYSEWKYIPFYRPSDSFKKLSMDEIHKLYYRSSK
jgi:hypothetical protein